MVVTDATIHEMINGFMFPLMRISSALMVLPLYGNRMLPARIRIALVLVLVAVIAPMIEVPAHGEIGSWLGAGIIVQEILVGLLIGLGINVVFSAIIHGAQIIAMQMGLGFASMIDPANGINVPVLSQFYIVLATLLFMSTNAHLGVLSAILESYRIVPIGSLALANIGITDIVYIGKVMLEMAVLLALPIVTALLIINLAFGVMARAAPQLNIFAVGFPLTMLGGFVLMLITLEGMVSRMTLLVVDGWQPLVARLLGAG
ncbi:MAG: flagellar biosynthetic protein FliR [Gammaproteobacteria bacterium]|nr:flagellar biosynthetic protein FliR [Gammaproteobacteria bacterium]